MSPRVLRWLSNVERLGNKLPDPALLFVLFMGLVWLLSAVLAQVQFDVVDPRTKAPLVVNSLLSPAALVTTFTELVRVFTGFQPLGVVLVVMLGAGVAEHAGLVQAVLKGLLAVTPRRALVPMVAVVGILSHTAADAGFVVVIPLAGVVFHAAGRHPLAGIALAFAAVSGGFSASFVPNALDPLLQGFTQSAAQLIDPDYLVNPLCGYFFTASSAVLVVGACWWVTEKVVEPRLAGTVVDGDLSEAPRFEALSAQERRGLWAAGLVLVALGVAVVAAVWPHDSVLRAADGALTSAKAPLMQGVVTLLFLGFLLPGLAYGRVAGTLRSHRDVVRAMSSAMGTMSTYLVMAFFAALFIDAFGRSNLGALLAMEGAEALRSLAMPAPVTVLALVGATMLVDLLVGSASAKWALLAPVFVPMLMQLGLAPELTQTAYRVGDSVTNIVTPLMPYFPLIVVYCQRYVRGAGIGTVLSMMIPYSVVLTATWVGWLLLYWALGLPLGLGGAYQYP